MFKRSIIGSKKFKDNKQNFGEDLIFFLDIIPNVKKIAFVKEPLCHYMVREGSLIQTATTEKLDVFKMSSLI